MNNTTQQKQQQPAPQNRSFFAENKASIIFTNGESAPYRNALHGSEAPLLRRRGVVAPFYASGLSPPR